MKKIILFFIFILCSLALCGQPFTINLGIDINKHEMLDSVLLKVTYKMSFVWDVKKPDKISIDMQILEIGDNLSKYYSRYLAVDYPEFLKKNPGTKEGIPQNPERGTQPYEIYKNYPLCGEQTITDISDGVGLYFYEEPIPIFDWKLHDEFTDVRDYRCQKATTSFRGRDYTAWFTTEIPVSNGPWKFGGLPGLIMKITDSEGHYDFECIGIEQPKDDLIKFYEGKFAKIARKDYMKLYQRKYNDFVLYAESLGISVIVGTRDGKDSTLKTGEFPPQPYNPIERE